MAAPRFMIAAAEPPMAELARTVNETVLLAALRLGRRFVLSQINGQQQIQVGSHEGVVTSLVEDSPIASASVDSGHEFAA